MLLHDDLLKEASRQMLGKDHPEERDDWVKVMNFVAWNTDFPASLDACYAIARLNNVPLREHEIKDIVDFQGYTRSVRDLTLQTKSDSLLGDQAIRDADEFLREISPAGEAEGEGEGE